MRWRRSCSDTRRAATSPRRSRPNAYINYYAGYAQDDLRVNPKLTVNLGLRYEFEQGLQEKDNGLTVGFDRERPWPVQVPGLALKGGLMYAGVDGYPTHQSDPSKTKFAPRVGFAWSPNSKTVVRGGYGLFYAPHQYAGIGSASLGTQGFTQRTDTVASTDGGLTPCAGCNIVNPFPRGIADPTGSAGGLLTGAGGTVQFIDQFRKSAYVHQYSLDFQRELPGRIVGGISYIGATSRHLGLGGNDDATININQLDPRYQSLGAALLDQVPNPFFGNSAFGSFADQETISRGQLLRPYPQFGDLLGGQVSDGRSQYHSVVLRLERPMVGGWGGRINYTWSSNKNNVFGELNQFSNNSGDRNRPLNSYDVDAEYGHSITEQPHRLNYALTAELPFGRGKKHLSEPGFARVLLGGWSITAVGYFQTGFPVTVVQATNTTGLFSRVQRPNLTGSSPVTSGSTDSHYDSSCGCIANWFNPRRVVDGSGLHLRRRSAHRHPYAHAVQDPDRRGVPEDRAHRRHQGDHDPIRDDQPSQQRPVQRAGHHVRGIVLRHHHGHPRLPAPAPADGKVRVLTRAAPQGAALLFFR